MLGFATQAKFKEAGKAARLTAVTDAMIWLPSASEHLASLVR